MNLFKLSASYLRAQPLNTTMNLLVLALGMGTITLLLLLGQQLEERLGRDAQGIDLVVGAKGSPLQIILANLYHLDMPTGNIPHSEALSLARDPLVARAIPLALGDNYRGFRIVGSSHDYPAHFGVTPQQGRLWQRPMEAVLGAEVARQSGLQVGDHFVGTHGLSDGGGQAHDETPYTVVGILHRQHGVLDRLVLTGLESVWSVHGDHGHEDEHGHEHEHEHDEHAHHDHPDTEAQHTPARRDSERQLTAVLIQYRSPMGAVLLPRQINQRSHLQAAVPAVELTRLLQLFGVGLDTLRLFGLLLIASAALGVFIALYNTLRERQYDLAIMRTLGASRLRLFNHILLEGVILAVLGSLLGILLGHIGMELLGNHLAQARQLELTGWIWLDAEWGLLLLALCIGLLAALLPAIQAYRSDIAHILAKG